MASYSLNSSDVELHESEIAKPRPLRIIKRSQTIAGSSSSTETLSGRRGTSSESNESMGTPPGGDKPINVRKTRIRRASTRNWALEGSLVELSPMNSNPARFNELDGEVLEQKSDAFNLKAWQDETHHKMTKMKHQRQEVPCQELSALVHF